MRHPHCAARERISINSDYQWLRFYALVKKTRRAKQTPFNPWRDRAAKKRINQLLTLLRTARKFKIKR